MVLPVVKPLQKAVMEEWLKARGCEILREDGDAIYVKVDLPCQHLNKSEDGWTCDIYDTEGYPKGCRLFDGTQYDFLKCKWKEQEHVVLEKSIQQRRKEVLEHDKSLILEAPFEKAGSHKYLKREGAPGKYVYTYAEAPEKSGARFVTDAIKEKEKRDREGFTSIIDVKSTANNVANNLSNLKAQRGYGGTTGRVSIDEWHEPEIKPDGSIEVTFLCESLKIGGPDDIDGNDSKAESVLIGKGKELLEMIWPNMTIQPQFSEKGYFGFRLTPKEKAKQAYVVIDGQLKPIKGIEKLKSPQLPEGFDKLGYELPEDWKEAQKIVEPLLDKYGRIDTGITYLDKDDVKKKIRMEIRKQKYPYEDQRLHVWAEPVKGPSGTGSVGYRKIKTDLGDDWSSDITATWWEEGHEMGTSKQARLNKVVEAVRKYFEPGMGHLSSV